MTVIIDAARGCVASAKFKVGGMVCHVREVSITQRQLQCRYWWCARGVGRDRNLVMPLHFSQQRGFIASVKLTG